MAFYLMLSTGEILTFHRGQPKDQPASIGALASHSQLLRLRGDQLPVVSAAGSLATPVRELRLLYISNNTTKRLDKNLFFRGTILAQAKTGALHSLAGSSSLAVQHSAAARTTSVELASTSLDRTPWHSRFEEA